MLFLFLGYSTHKKQEGQVKRTFDLTKRIREWWDHKSEKPRIMMLGYISMQDAARRFYEAAKARKIPFGDASEKLSGWSENGPTPGSPEDILDWWAEHISKTVKLYGRRPPSSLLTEIPEYETRTSFFAMEPRS